MNQSERKKNSGPEKSILFPNLKQSNLFPNSEQNNVELNKLNQAFINQPNVHLNKYMDLRLEARHTERKRVDRVPSCHNSQNKKNKIHISCYIIFQWSEQEYCFETLTFMFKDFLWDSFLRPENFF